MTLKQVLEKYPHLAELHFEDLLEQDEKEKINETTKEKDLLLG
tara:strand:+ start:488 stop:616 length:129 start_codon:yes stop_codon:yes gene_type:complete